MITIKKPIIETNNDKVVLKCPIIFTNSKKEIFYEIDKEYEKYLCTERADAFVIAAFFYAMRYGEDITSEMPITTEIYHNLTTYLIPTLAKHSKRLKEIKINAKTVDNPVKTKGEVGTGISCGVDSFHVLKNYLNPALKEMKLTCLCVNNVGSFKAYSERYRGIGSDKAREKVIKRAKKIAKAVNLPLIVTNSNIYEVFPDVYYRNNTFANMFSVFLMQKFFGKYFYASLGLGTGYYNVTDNYHLDSAEFDILTFYALSNKTLKIYSEGAEKTRLEKTIDIADFKLARENLHVCIKDGNNCGKCLKCRRTILMLDAIGKLDNFKKVFDIEYYKEHKEEYYKWLDKEIKHGDVMNKPTYDLLNQKEGKSSYDILERYNEKNIILPNTNIKSLVIKDKDYLLTKNMDLTYNNFLAYKFLVAIEISKLKNKEIEIPKYLLDNIKVYYRNKKTLKKKLGYIKRIILKKRTKIYLHDLIYFVLYKTSTFNNIVKFLTKEGYINVKSIKTSSNSLALIASEIANNKVLKKILQTEEIEIKGKTLKNKYLIKKTNDSYYSHLNLDNLLCFKGQNYYLFGTFNGYTVAVINKYQSDKKIYKDMTEIYGLIKLFNEN